MSTSAPWMTFIATSDYRDHMFQYSIVSTQGVFTPLSTIYSTSQGHFLVESGLRLYPQFHPGVSTLLVNVRDFTAQSNSQSISGFINPYNSIFSTTTIHPKEYIPTLQNPPIDISRFSTVR